MPPTAAGLLQIVDEVLMEVCALMKLPASDVSNKL